MEITWLGHSCFRIKGKEATIITDPFDKTLGYPLKKLNASIVTVSHQHPQHSNTEVVEGDPKIISKPGEYEVANVFIQGFATFHDGERGEKRGKNIVYLIHLEDINICHLGDLGHIPATYQIEQLGDTDILMVPVGGVSTIDATAAAETVRLLQPRLVIPMHYKTGMVKMQLDPVDLFLKAMALKEIVPQPKLSLNKSSLPEGTSVVILDYPS